MPFNVAGAKAAGYSDQEIQSYLASKQQVPAAQSQQTQGGGFADFLPLLGVIGGSFIPGLGPILGGALGAGGGTLLKQGIQGQFNPGEVATQAGLAGLGGFGGKLLGGLLGHFLPGALEKAGIGAIGSQFGNIGKGVARANQMGDTLSTLAGRYGLTSPEKIAMATPEVTGPTGVGNISKLRAIAQAQPVELGAYQTAVGTEPSILDRAQTLNGGLIASNQKIFNHAIQSGIQQAYGGTEGNISGMADPTKTFQFIQDLGAKIDDLIGRGRSPTAITSQDKALAQAYTQIKTDLEHRLYNISGANSQIIGNLTEKEYKTLEAIHPQLAADMNAAQTIPERRTLEAAFVRGSNLAKESEMTGQTGFQNIGQTAQGLGKTIPTLANPFAPITTFASQPGVNAAVGGAALKGANLLRGLTLPSENALQRAGVATGVGLGTNQGQPQTAENIPQSVSASGGQANIPTQQSLTPQDTLRQQLGIYILSRARNANDLVAGYNLLYPKQAQNAQTQIRAKTGIDVIQNIQQIPKEVLAKTGTPEAAIVNAKLTSPGNIGRFLITPKENELASLEQQYFILVQGVLTALQGSRPSDYDVKSYQNKAGPSIQFPNYVNQRRIQNLLNLLESTSNQQQSSIPFPANYPGIGQ